MLHISERLGAIFSRAKSRDPYRTGWSWLMQNVHEAKQLHALIFFDKGITKEDIEEHNRLCQSEEPLPQLRCTPRVILQVVSAYQVSQAS